MLTVFEVIRYMWKTFCMVFMGLVVWSGFYWLISGESFGIINFWGTIPFAFVLYIIFDACKAYYNYLKQKQDK